MPWHFGHARRRLRNRDLGSIIQCVLDRLPSATPGLFYNPAHRLWRVLDPDGSVRARRYGPVIPSGWRSTCPNHPERSLSVILVAGRVEMTSSCCTQAQICAAIGLRETDLESTAGRWRVSS